MASAAQLPLASIKLHPDLQIRGGTDYATVRRYAREMRGGTSFPPIALAEVGANLYIIDGHHRYEAAQHAGHVAIAAIKRRMSLPEATREAYASNQDHGRSLTQREKQHAFARYIEMRLHLDEWEMVKPLRQIAAECRVYTFQTIGKKLKELGIKAPRDGVKPYRPGDGFAHDELTEDDLALEQALLFATFKEQLAATMASYGRLDEQRGVMALAELKELVRGLNDPEAPCERPLEI